jgi:hypothetical protein
MAKRVSELTSVIFVTAGKRGTRRQSLSPVLLPLSGNNRTSRFKRGNLVKVTNYLSTPLLLQSCTGHTNRQSNRTYCEAQQICGWVSSTPPALFVHGHLVHRGNKILVLPCSVRLCHVKKLRSYAMFRPMGTDYFGKKI